MIFDFTAKNLAEYLKNGAGCVMTGRPERCWNCKNEQCYWSNGSYWRWVEESGKSNKIKISRFECKYCGKTVSILPFFVVPYYRYTIKVIATGVENYATTETTYRLEASRLGATGPSPAELFRWAASLLKRIEELLLALQRQCILACVLEEELELNDQAICPNSWKARMPGKPKQLNLLAKLISYGKNIFRELNCGTLEQIFLFFLKDIEQAQHIFSCQRHWLSTPHNMKPALF